MEKIIRIEVPDRVDEKDVKDLVERYVELKLPDSITREKYISLANVKLEEIVEFSPDEEFKILKELREKAKKRSDLSPC